MAMLQVCKGINLAAIQPELQGPTLGSLLHCVAVLFPSGRARVQLACLHSQRHTCMLLLLSGVCQCSIAQGGAAPWCIAARSGMYDCTIADDSAACGSSTFAAAPLHLCGTPPTAGSKEGTVVRQAYDSRGPATALNVPRSSRGMHSSAALAVGCC
jgi:hypothetical protein